MRSRVFLSPAVLSSFLRLFGLLVIFAPTVAAQGGPTVLVSAPKPLDTSLAVLRTDVNLVLVPVTVTDQLNRPVLGLESKDFLLLDEKQPQRIDYFFSEDAPMSIGLVLDFSGSMQPKQDALRESVRQFFNNANPDDDYYVVAVSTTPKVIARGSQSLREIEAALSNEQPIGWTSLLDAVDLTLDIMKNSRYSRRAIVIVSDGGENDSHLSRSHVLKEVEESNADVYAVAIFDEPLLFMKPVEERLGKRLLTRLSDVTGGRTISIDNAAKLPETFSNLSREMRSRYVLGYRPSNLKHDGHWRKVKVELTVPLRRAQVQTYFKKGYVDPHL